MFSKIRSLFSSKFGAVFALIFIAIIAIAFALGDVTGSGTFGGVSAGNAAKVGNQDVTISELREMTDNRVRAERQRNPNLDIATFVEGGGMDSTLEQIISRYVLAVYAEKHGIGVSKAMVDAEIRDIPGAKGIDGKVSSESLQILLQRLQISEAAIRKDFMQNLYAQQIFPITKNAIAPNAMALPYASLVLERREGQLAVVPSTLFLPEKAPTDDELAAFYKKNSTQYIIPERRSVSYALFGSDIVDAQAKATDAEIKAYYDENKAEFAASETRDIDQIIAPTKAAADQILAKVKSGVSMQSAAQDIGLSVTSIENLSRSSLSSSASKAVSDAVFAANEDGFAAAARGALGFYVVKVTGASKTNARTLDQASGEIAALVTAQKKSELIAELTTEIEDALADGSTITDIAKERSLKIETTPSLVATGQDPENPNYKPIPEMAIILPSAFQLQNDGEAQLIEVEPGTRFAMITVAKLSAAAPPPLAKVKQGVAQRWALSKGLAKSKIEAEKILKSVQSGKSLSKAIADSGLDLPPIQPLKANRFELSQSGQQVPAALALMFSMSAGSTKKLEAPSDQGWILVDLNKIIRGDASKRTNVLDQTKKQFETVFGQEHLAQFINAARAEVGVEKSEDEIETLRKSLTAVTPI